MQEWINNEGQHSPYSPGVHVDNTRPCEGGKKVLGYLHVLKDESHGLMKQDPHRRP